MNKNRVSENRCDLVKTKTRCNMKNCCDKMGTVPILLQRFFSRWRQSQGKSLTLNSTIEILRTHKIAAILTVAVAHCERALSQTFADKPFIKVQVGGDAGFSLCGG